jgi:hypothetical protein
VRAGDHVLSEGEASGLVDALKALRASAGHPSVREIAARAGDMSHTTVAQTLAGRRLPRWPVTSRIIEALGGDSAELRHLWDAAARDESPDIVEGFEQMYRRQATVIHGRIRVPDFDRVQSMPLTEAFVFPKIDMLGAAGSRSLPFSEFISQIQKAVLLGGPGSGKTATCLALMNEYAEDSTQPIPFFIPVREMMESVPKKMSVLEFVQARCGLVYQCSVARPVLDSLFAAGRALVIFDGLDEVLQTSDRADAPPQIEAFVTRYPKLQVLVTSRLVGYSNAPLNSAIFREFRLAELDEQMVHAFVYRSWPTDGQSRIKPEQVISLLAEPIFKDLARTPLLLALLLQVWQHARVLPRDRLELIEACTRLAIDRWDHNRGIGPNVSAASQSLMPQLLGRVASEIIERGVSYLSWPELVSVLAREIAAHNNHESDSLAAAVEVAEQLRDRAFILTEVGIDQWGESLYAFSYRAFLEYFAARRLVRSLADPDALAEALLPYVINPGHWQVAELAIDDVARYIDGGDVRTRAHLKLIAAQLPDQEQRRLVSSFLKT